MTAKRITMDLKNVISNKKAKYKWIKNEWNISRTTLYEPSYNYFKKVLKMKINKELHKAGQAIINPKNPSTYTKQRLGKR